VLKSAELEVPEKISKLFIIISKIEYLVTVNVSYNKEVTYLFAKYHETNRKRPYESSRLLPISMNLKCKVY